ncbi:hypothetical protein IAR50_000115 [Cryptococcus sp. DSM 104548]
MSYSATLFALLTILPSALAAVTAGTTYSISPAQHAGMCIAPKSTREGAKLVLKDCDEDDTTWLWTGSALQNTATSMCVDIPDAGKWSGNKAQVWGCYSWNTNQQYTIEGAMIHWDDFCFDLKDGSSKAGTEVQIWSCYSYNDNQQWTFTEIEEVDESCTDSTTVSSTVVSTATASVSELFVSASATSSASSVESVSASETYGNETASLTQSFASETASASDFLANETVSATQSLVNETASATQSLETASLTDSYASYATDSASSLNSTASATLSSELANSTSNSSIGDTLWAGGDSDSSSASSSASSADDWWATSTSSDAWASATASASVGWSSNSTNSSEPTASNSSSDAWASATASSSNPWETASASNSSSDVWGSATQSSSDAWATASNSSDAWASATNSSDSWASATNSSDSWASATNSSDSWASATASSSNAWETASNSSAESWESATSSATNPWETASSTASDSWNTSSTDSWGASATASATQSSSSNGTATATTATSAISATASVGTISSGYLQTSGSKIVDSDGNTVVLRGTNIGGYLVLEDWMCGITDDTGSSDRFSLTTLENRFGTDEARTLVEAWADNWLTTNDFDELVEIGFNVIRLPFSFRTVQNADGTWRDDAFTRMDWVVANAKARGIYVIIDFHMWPGQEASYSAISENTDDGASQRAAVGEIWKNVSTHYLNEPAIFGFDVINEPTGSYGDYLQQDLYNAVRAVDANRIIIHESISTDPSTYGWTNVIYSIHEYNMMGSDLDSNKEQWTSGVQNYIDTWSGYGIPTLLGEFMADGETLDYILNQANAQGLSWLSWAHSTVNMGRWGLWNHGAFYVNVGTDSYDTILSTWSNMPSTSHTSVYDQFKSGASGSTSVSRKRDTIVVAPKAQTTKRLHASHGGRSRRGGMGMAHAARGVVSV